MLYLVANLLGEMIEYWKLQKATPLYNYNVFNPVLYEECKKLAEAIRDSIEKGQPEQALDRLHTFVIKYVRELCTRRGIPFDKDTPLHSLFGLYLKFLQKRDLIESEMSERSLKSSISTLDAFNAVRNNQSFAHDNPLLNYNESVLIFNEISNTLRFVERIEHKIAEEDAKSKAEREKAATKREIVWNDIEFTDEEMDAAGDAWIQNQLDRSRGK